MLRKSIAAIYRDNLAMAASRLTSLRYNDDVTRAVDYSKDMLRISEFAEAFQREYGCDLEAIKREHDQRVDAPLQGLLTKLVKGMQQRAACKEAADKIKVLHPKYARFSLAA